MVKIIGFEAENFKRLTAVELELSTKGLTVIGGNNRQGKTSVLDAIKSLVLGEKYTPTNALHEGTKKGKTKIDLDNGLSISTTYTKNGRTALKIEGSHDIKGGPQAVVNSVFGVKALDISRVLDAKESERTQILLEIIGVDLTPYNEKHKELYSKRTEIHKVGARAKGHYESMPYHEELGTDIVTASDLIKEQQAVLQKNAENKSLRDRAVEVQREIDGSMEMKDRKLSRLQELKAMVQSIEGEIESLTHEIIKKTSAKEAADKETEGLEDHNTAELEAKLAEIDETNAKIRENQERAKAEADMKAQRQEYSSLSNQIEQNKAEMEQLLDDAEMPLEELSVADGILTYQDRAWDCMSTAEQYKVAAAIQAKLTPDAPVLLVDRLEIMDEESMVEFGEWAEANDYQIIGTRVSKGEECDYIIEDGMVAGDAVEAPEETETKTEAKKPSFSL